MSNEQKTFEEMTNDELKTLCADFDLTVSAKNPAKPNKSELLVALNEFKTKQDIINGNIEAPVESTDINVEPVKEVLASKLPRSKRKKLQWADLSRKECVFITDMRQTQTNDHALFVSWGNGLIGHHTDVVNLEGRNKQYIRRGALANLRNVTMEELDQEDFGGELISRPVPRFLITPAEGLSYEELKKKRVEQQIKAANAV